jgi:hypothetical protein
MNGLGSPKVAYSQAQRIYSPTDTGWIGSGRPFTNVAVTTGNLLDVSGYGMWSVYAITNSVAVACTLTVQIMDELDGSVLIPLQLTAVLDGNSVNHTTFGTPGTTVPVVPARLVMFGVIATGGAGPFQMTLRCFGRGF